MMVYDGVWWSYRLSRRVPSCQIKRQCSSSMLDAGLLTWCKAVRPSMLHVFGLTPVLMSSSTSFLSHWLHAARKTVPRSKLTLDAFSFRWDGCWSVAELAHLSNWSLRLKAADCCLPPVSADDSIVVGLILILGCRCVMHSCCKGGLLSNVTSLSDLLCRPMYTRYSVDKSWYEDLLDISQFLRTPPTLLVFFTICNEGHRYSYAQDGNNYYKPVAVHHTHIHVVGYN